MPSRRPSTRSTARPPATRSPPACSSRCCEGLEPEEALRRSCAAGALAASRFGAQPSLPTARRGRRHTPAVTTPVILDCDPGHDDAIALLLALASPEIELVGVTTTHGNQTLDKTTDNALRLLALVDRTDVPVAVGAERPLVRELHVAAHVHGESGLDGPELPARASEPVEQSAVDFLVDHVTPETVLVAVGPLTNVAQALDRGIRPAPHRADGRRDRRGEHDPGGRVQHLGRSRSGAARLPLRARRDDDRARRHPRRAPDSGVGRPFPRGGPGRARSSPSWSTSSSSTTRGRTAGTGRRSTTPSRSRTRSGPGSSRPSG